MEKTGDPETTPVGSRLTSRIQTLFDLVASIFFALLHGCVVAGFAYNGVEIRHLPLALGFLIDLMDNVRASRYIPWLILY